MIPRKQRITYIFVQMFSIVSACLLEDGRSSVYLSVFEDLEPGELVGKIPIEGFTQGSDITLRLVKGNELLSLPEGTNELKLLTPLDRDENMSRAKSGSAKFEAVVECQSKQDSDFNQQANHPVRDPNDLKKSSLELILLQTPPLNISVLVTVKDVNDNAPQFDQTEYHFNVSEELPVGTIVYTDLSATDKDQPGPNSFLQYTILPSKHSHLLGIEDPFKPVIIVKDRIDYETVRSFTIQVEARDQGVPSQASVVPVHVTVEDQNDLSPVFEHKYYVARKILEGELVVGPSTVKAVDGDALNASISYDLSGELSSHFAIDHTGHIRVRSNPPPPFAVFFIHAYEEENPDKNSTAIIRVQLGSNIHFENDLYNIKIASATPKGTVLLRPKAYSETWKNGKKQNARLKYSMSTSHGIVSMDPSTGTIIMGELPMQLRPFYEFNITATDSEDVTTARMHVFVDAVSDCLEGPKFENPEYTVQMESLSLMGPLRVNMEHVIFELLNMKRDFIISGDGHLSLRPQASPQCVICELVILAKDQQGRVGLAKVTIRTGAFVMATSSVLTILILIILAFIFALLVIFVCRKVSHVWRQNKHDRMCYLNRSTDTGVVISGTGSNRYVVNPTKDSRLDTSTTIVKSPAPPRASGAHLVPVTVSNHDGAPTVYF